MRQIKVRVPVFKSDVFDGFREHELELSGKSYAFGNCHFIGDYRFEPIQEFTGYADMNRDELWEGDIVENEETIFVIEWNQNQCAWWLTPISSKIDEDSVLMFMNSQKLGNGYLHRSDLKLTGHIYKNPKS